MKEKIEGHEHLLELEKKGLFGGIFAIASRAPSLFQSWQQIVVELTKFYGVAHSENGEASDA